MFNGEGRKLRGKDRRERGEEMFGANGFRQVSKDFSLTGF